MRSFQTGSPLVCSCQSEERNRERGWRGTNVIIHRTRAHQYRARIVRPLRAIQLGTIHSVRFTVIIHSILLVDQADSPHPVPQLDSPLRVHIVACIPRQAGGDIEQTPVGNGVLKIKARDGIDLPPDAPITRSRIPSSNLLIEHRLRQTQPTRILGVGRIGEVVLRSLQRGHSPESLVVVSQGLGLVGRHVVVVWPDLELHCLNHYGVVGCVAGVVPVVYQRAEHGACFPPVVRAW